MKLIHGNDVTEIKLEDIGNLYSPGRTGEAGYASLLYVMQMVLIAQPGDLIVKD